MFFALTLDRVGHIVVHVKRARAFLRRIREAAHAIELHLFEKVTEHRKVFFCLAREANNHGCAHGQIRYDVAIPL